jgi:hypothetical protein
MSQRLEHRLVLCDYLYDLFGMESFDDFRSELEGDKQGYAEDGHSYFYHSLVGQTDREISQQRLAEYDLNIKEYLEDINRVRDRSIQLKYFQYLSVLFTEIYLDSYFPKKGEFLGDLNTHLEDWNNRQNSEDAHILSFQEDDLDKLAFWMATGSGKTIIFHINYHQFLHYNDTELDNILLITPNESLTEQHIEDMREANISCSAFNKNAQTLLSTTDQEVKVIDIHKLGEDPGDKTVDVDAFEGNNLVFVDEGHKGSGGDVWMDYRNRVVSDGFVFEYSATFGQAINAANNKELLEDYSKSILIDYSYNDFYQDGYGKDYRILNLDSDISKDLTDMWLLGNLLSFYEQMRYFEENQAAIQEYRLERPLWIFVGGRVNAVYTRHGEETSDVLTVLEFLHRFLSQHDWAEQGIQALMNGTSGLEAQGEDNIFEEHYKYLREQDLTATEIYHDALSRLFHTDHPTQLQVDDLKRQDDEIGVKAANSNQHFGVVNIGDTSDFLSLLDEYAPDIGRSEDEFTNSLFGNIKDESSDVNVLLGSKKFIEGWDTWRVSNMGLMNVAKSEGSEVIQLFGRGVRLKGKDFCLKRSGRLQHQETSPDHIDILETLNIFGVQADYMDQFRQYLEEEGIEIDHWEEELEVRVPNDLAKKGLKVPRVDTDRDFKQEATVTLTLDRDLDPTVDLRPEIEVLQSINNNSTATGKNEEEQSIPPSVVPFLDWDEVYFELLEYKRQKGLDNLSIERDILRGVIEAEAYTLYCPPSDLEAVRFDELDSVQRTVEVVLKTYLDAFYNTKRDEWESRYLEYQTLDETDENFPDNYTLTIPESNEEAIQTVKSVIEEADAVYEQDRSDFPNVYFEKHLYQPLLATDSRFEAISPTGLNEGEAKFVRHLRDYVHNQWSGTEDGDQVYLLRNLPKRGIGFFEAGNFYPDFVLWIKRNETQYIVFVDPKGLQHIGINHKKIQFYETIKKIEDRLDDSQIILESFIVSNTPPEDAEKTHGVSKEEFEEQHVLFQDDDAEYICQLFDEILSTAE